MKIEKLNDHQIRCTLTKEDLASRQIKLSELAYGSEKTKLLFRDMMEQASEDFGFEAGDIPLMIEAIPLSPEKIVLIISKVENPDELDTRFSRFTQDMHPDSDEEEAGGEEPAECSELMHLIDALKQTKSGPADAAANTRAQTGTPAEERTRVQSGDRERMRIFSFRKLDTAITVANAVCSFYTGRNTLYKDEPNDLYYLILEQSPHTLKDFNRVSHIASEYMNTVTYTPQAAAFLNEHLEVILRSNALQTLDLL